MTFASLDIIKLLKMVLGLIDFLLGGKKKTKVPKNAQVAATSAGPINYGGGAAPQQQADLNVQQQMPQQNLAAQQNLEFQDSNNNQQQTDAGQNAAVQQTAQNNNYQNQSPVNKKSITDVINKIHKEIKETNDTVTSLVSEVKDVQTKISGMDHRISELETSNKTVNEKIGEVDDNMSKFLSLYELVNNQYNPFVEKEAVVKKEIVVNSDGSSEDTQANLADAIKNLPDAGASVKQIDLEKIDNLESSLLELDTLNIEEAAADAVPLTRIKSNTNSLVIILSWLEYLVKRVGIDESRNALRYYTETLKWTTPEVFFELDKFLRGMDDIIESDKERAKGLSVKDHIVSLYFISKLNEKVLDEKLTKAVLKIIKN